MRQWYFIHTYSGHENKVVESLNARIRELFGLTNLLSVFESCGRYGTRLP